MKCLYCQYQTIQMFIEIPKMTCHNCHVSFIFDGDSLEYTVFNARVNERAYILELNHLKKSARVTQQYLSAPNSKMLEPIYSTKVLFSGAFINNVTPDNVMDKIKSVLIFL